MKHLNNNDNNSQQVRINKENVILYTEIIPY